MPEAKAKKVSILELRGVPASGGVFLGDRMPNGEAAPKLVPGEVREVTAEVVAKLSDECKALLKIA